MVVIEQCQVLLLVLNTALRSNYEWASPREQWKRVVVCFASLTIYKDRSTVLFCFLIKLQTVTCTWEPERQVCFKRQNCAKISLWRSYWHKSRPRGSYATSLWCHCACLIHLALEVGDPVTASQLLFLVSPIKIPSAGFLPCTTCARTRWFGVQLWPSLRGVSFLATVWDLDVFRQRTFPAVVWCWEFFSASWELRQEGESIRSLSSSSVF